MRNRPHLPQFLSLALALAFLPGLAFASGSLVILAQTEAQGTIEGESTLQFHENWINVFSFSHGVSVPTGSNGVPTGPAITSPLDFMSKFDSSTIQMFRAQVNQEVFSIFRMEWVDAATGQTLFRYDLTNARVISAQESGSGGGDDAPSLSMSINYSRITIVDLVQGTNMSYDWNPGSTAAPPESVAKGILLPPSPNPTHGQTEFRFSLPADSNATLELFDVRGRRVREVYSGQTSRGDTVAIWDGKDDSGLQVAQGIYLARLVYPGREVTQRITVLR